MTDIEARAKVQGDTKEAVAALQRLSKSVDSLVAGNAEGRAANAKFAKSFDQLAAKAKTAGKAMLIDYGQRALRALKDGADELADRQVRVATTFKNLEVDISGARDATNGLITDFELAAAANTAVRFGVAETSEGFAEVAGAAAKLAATTGGDVPKAIDDAIGALARGSAARLDNLGVTLKQEEAQELYAKRLGKSSKELTDTERKEAFLTIGRERLISASRELSVETENLGGAYQQAKVAAQNAVDAQLAGQDATVSLRGGFRQLTEAQLSASLSANVYGVEMERLKKRLSALGVDVSNLTAQQVKFASATEVARRALQRQADDAERIRKAEARQVPFDEARAKATEARAKRTRVLTNKFLKPTQGQIQALQKSVVQADLAVAQLEGNAGQISNLTEQLEMMEFAGSDAAKSMGRVAAETEKAAAAHTMFTQVIAAVDLTEVTAQRDIAIIEREIEAIQRQAQERQARGIETLSLENEIFDRRMEIAALTSDSIEREDMQLQAAHERQLARLSVRMAREAEREKQAQKIAREELRRTNANIKMISRESTTFVRANIDSTVAAIQASEKKGEAFAKALSVFAQQHAKELGMQALEHTFSGIGYSIALNPVKASAEFAAAKTMAGFAAGFAGVALASGLPAAGGIGDRSALRGGEGAEFAALRGGGVNRPEFGQGVGEVPGGPLSPLEEELSRPGVGAARSGSAGGSTVINFNGDVLDDVALLQRLRQVERREGRILA